MKKYFLIWMVGLIPAAYCDAVIPVADKPGSQDNPLLKRYDGAFVVYQDRQNFAEFTFPLSPLEKVPGKSDRHNNQYYEPRKKQTVEGIYTRLVYLLPAQRSPLEVLRNYQQEIKNKGGKTVFECKGEECGGDPFSTYGGGGSMSLTQYLYPEERISGEPFASNGSCALGPKISEQRFFTAELPSAGGYVAVHTYTMSDGGYCKAFNQRTIAILDMVENKAREQKMVTVGAEDMAREIAKSGSIALYGILFDFNKDTITPQSATTLAEIARYLRQSPAIQLFVVGHTDNAGALAFNMDLSQRRAAAVANTLVAQYQIDRSRLTAAGVGQTSPAASNHTEEGRAKNRRVELVEK